MKMNRRHFLNDANFLLKFASVNVLIISWKKLVEKISLDAFFYHPSSLAMSSPVDGSCFIV